MSESKIKDRPFLEELCRETLKDDSLRHTVNAVVLLEVDHYQKIRSELGADGMEVLMQRIASALNSFVDEKTVVVRYSEMTYGIAFHALSSLEELEAKCHLVHDYVKLALPDMKYSVSVGSAQCHHHPVHGFHCPFDWALKALNKAQEQGDGVEILTGEFEKLPDPSFGTEAQNQEENIRIGNISLQELSVQEVQILKALTSGANNDALGLSLKIAPSSVKTFVQSLLAKTGFRSRTELAVAASEVFASEPLSER